MSHIKIIKVTMLLALLGIIPANAADVYIEQVGSSSTIDITQTGDGNRVGSSSDSASIYGTGSDVDIIQNGSNNELDLETTTGAGSTTTKAFRSTSTCLSWYCQYSVRPFRWGRRPT